MSYHNIKKIKFAKKAKIVGNIIALPLIPPLFLLKKFWKIQLVRLRTDRIGHLAGNTEVYLRRIKLGIIDPKIKPIGIALQKTANQQLLTMFGRQMKIITLPDHKYVKALRQIIFKHSLLGTLNLVEGIGWWNKSLFYELNNAGPILHFTAEEEKLGTELRAKMDVSEKSFICFHARDAAYLNLQWAKGDSYHNYRNCSIDNYLKAADYFTEQGGYALRMGSVVEKKITSKNKKIIDYATLHRTDFGDIYLPAKCKFFLGNTAGLFMIPTIFNVPVANANLVSIAYPPFRKEDLFIPSKIWDEKKQRFLTFKEIIDNNVMYFADGKEFAAAGLKIIENTPEEILDLAIEMNQRLDGTWKKTTHDEQLQAKYKSLFPQDSPCYGSTSRIGALFLRKNKALLE